MARKIIIDTDPGVDDILAILLALSALPEELEVLLISVTYGNIDVQNCLRNVVSLFHHVEREIAWRKSQGRDPGFKSLFKNKPLVAVGPEHPLMDEMLMADYFHGRDGLGGIHESHPHMTPAETWKDLFEHAEDSTDPAEHAVAEEMQKTDALFVPSRLPASKEILRLLQENEPDTISIVAIGPLTNLALTASLDTETFLRAKEIVVMGGAVEERGNITPVAEFNTFADSVAAARLYALTSPTPSSTMPPTPPTLPDASQPNGPPPPFLGPYPSNLSRRLTLTLFPLDITHRHPLSRGTFRTLLAPSLAAGSPLAQWMQAFTAATFAKIESLSSAATGDAVAVDLHDPLCVWYCMSVDNTPGWEVLEGEDLRVETSGQWTRGMCVVDRRPRRKQEAGDEEEVEGDHDGWLNLSKGNRVRRCVQSPGEERFGAFLLGRVLGVE